MITERTLAKIFPSLWRNLFPFLTPNFMRIFNEAYVVGMKTEQGDSVSAVPMQADRNRSDLVAELAIHTTQLAVENDVSVERVYSDTDLLRTAWRSSQALIDRYEGRKPTTEFYLTDDEKFKACALAYNLEKLFVCLKGDIEFFPTIAGAGVIGECEADLAIGHTLFEIKTVNRNFQSKDLRQLLIYLALSSLAGERRWSYAGLVNPRRAVWCSFPVEPFVRLISGGRSLKEVSEELLAEISRDVQLDSIF